jgi:magnesium transporter
MLRVLSAGAAHPEALGAVPDPARLAEAAWIDLLDPSDAEREAVEQATGLIMRSRADLSEIENSSRLYAHDQTLYLSLPLAVGRPRGESSTSPLGFVLTPERLVTIRFARLPAFDAYMDQPSRGHGMGVGCSHVFIELIERLTDTMADTLELIRDELDMVSHSIFRPGSATNDGPSRDSTVLRDALQTVGRCGDLVSRVRDTLLGIGRIVQYVSPAAAQWITPELRQRLKTLRADIASLSDYDGHLSSKVQLLLDAILGLITIAQSNIIKVMTVVGVIGVPPTLIASVYGMNFEYMPELKLHYAYPVVMIAIVASALLPLMWFKRRGWL